MKAAEYSGSFNLLPCPFCDEDKDLEVVCGGGRCPHCGEPLGCWYCRCNSCGATTDTRDTLDQAIEDWNGASRGKDRGCAPSEQPKDEFTSPCPVCKTTEHLSVEVHDFCWTVCCNKCYKIRGPYCNDRAAAIAAWNSN